MSQLVSSRATHNKKIKPADSSSNIQTTVFVHNKRYRQLSLFYPFFHSQHKPNQPEELRLKDNSKSRVR